MAKKTRIKLKSMTTKLDLKKTGNLVFLLFLFSICGSFKKENNKDNFIFNDNTSEKINSSLHDIDLKGFFDYDHLEDKLFCNLVKEGREPLYKCNVIFGNKKEVIIEIPVASSSLQIYNCDKGCIETYQWITGADGYEEITTYLYDENLNNWFQEESNSIYKNGDTEKKSFNKEQWSIDSSILKIKNKNKLLSLYENIYEKFKSKSFNEINALILSVNLELEEQFTKIDLIKYNDIAYYLEQSGAYKEAIHLLEKIVKEFPNRTVAYINLGDAYWGFGDKEKAKQAYITYISQMKTSGKASKIPNIVLERSKL